MCITTLKNMSMNVPMQELESFLEHSKVPLPLRTMMTEIPKRPWVEWGRPHLADVSESAEIVDNVTRDTRLLFLYGFLNPSMHVLVKLRGCIKVWEKRGDGPDRHTPIPFRPSTFHYLKSFTPRQPHNSGLGQDSGHAPWGLLRALGSRISLWRSGPSHIHMCPKSVLQARAGDGG